MERLHDLCGCAHEQKVGIALRGGGVGIKVAKIQARQRLARFARIKIVRVEHDKNAGDGAVSHRRDQAVADLKQQGRRGVVAAIQRVEADLPVVEHGLRRGVDLAGERREVLRLKHLALQIVLAVIRLHLQNVDGVLFKTRVDMAEIEDADEQRDLDEQNPEHGAQDRIENGDVRRVIGWFAKDHKTASFLGATQ